ncbi:hypothetical protein [Azospirillum soli]|uniref:hypothetical protein n=1 Tax=Azospirillum soli TaxID=1304799 RepID=UPI001AE10117|nr:hypothetical protein [Azospirillum soli]MBP2315445.1 hypothetical protein [Azospirillum soli]
MRLIDAFVSNSHLPDARLGGPTLETFYQAVNDITRREIDALGRCPVRFVMSEDVAQAAALLTGKPEMLAKAVEVLRVPYPEMWIEWSERSRIEGLRKEGLLPDLPEGRHHPEKVGLWIKADASGRRGEFRVYWLADTTMATRADLICHFDFDSPVADHLIGVGERKGGCGEHFGLAPTETAAFTFTHRGNVLRPETLQRYICDNAADVATEIDHFVAALALLTAQRAIHTVEHEFGRLNRQRQKSGKPPLLDYREVRMSVSTAATRRAGGGKTENDRRAARLHWVRGHLKKRGEKLYWWSAHPRGTGTKPVTRTVTVMA